MDKVTCDLCYGRKYFRTKSNLPEYEPCPKCLGAGELNWIDRIFGVKPSGRTLYSVHLEGKIFWVEPDYVTGELREKVKHILEFWEATNPIQRRSIYKKFRKLFEDQEPIKRRY
jgi:hypothetical protein